MSKLAETIRVAAAADDAFEAAVKAAGYKSRWDWPARRGQVGTSAVWVAYYAKVNADNAMHEAFVNSRGAA
jgi:hypothetical protein